MIYNQNKSSLLLQFIVLVILTIFTKQLLVDKQPQILLDSVNLVFHEAGHVVFGLLGKDIGFLGGTLMQLIIPIAILTNFLYKKDFFGVGFSVFWIGDNFINISYYITDAPYQRLLLIGGQHDWAYLLGKSNLLHLAKPLADLNLFLGSSLIIIALIILVLNILYPFFTQK